MVKEKNPRFEKIDAECEKYKENIENAYKRFAEYKDIAKVSFDNKEPKHHAVITLYNEVFQNFVQILIRRKEMTDEDYYSPIKKPQKNILSLQLDVFCFEEEEIEKIFFSFSYEKKSNNKYPFFVYLDCALRPHFKAAIKKAVAQEVKTGLVFSNYRTELMTKIANFLDSNYSYMDYDRIPDFVLEEFLETENEKREKKLSFSSLKDTYLALRSKGISSELIAEKENKSLDRYYDGDEADDLIEFEEEQSCYRYSNSYRENLKEEYESIEEEYYEDLENEENRCEYTEDCSEYSFADSEYSGEQLTALLELDNNYTDPEANLNFVVTDTPELTFKNFRNKQWLSILDKCETEFKKFKPQYRKYISYRLTAYFIDKCIKSYGKTYKSAASSNKKAIDSFIENLKNYSFFSQEVADLFNTKNDKIKVEEVNDLFVKKNDKIETEDSEELFNNKPSTIYYHFNKFMKKVGLPITKTK